MKFVLRRIGNSAAALEAVALLDLALLPEFGICLDRDDLQSGVWWLAYSPDKHITYPVGFCGLLLTKNYTASFIRAGVLPAWRSKGLQGQMIARRLRYAHQLGYTNVQTYVHASNVHSVQALMHAGFVAHTAKKNKREGLWLYVKAPTARPKVTRRNETKPSRAPIK